MLSCTELLYLIDALGTGNVTVAFVGVIYPIPRYNIREKKEKKKRMAGSLAGWLAVTSL